MKIINRNRLSDDKINIISRQGHLNSHYNYSLYVQEGIGAHEYVKQRNKRYSKTPAWTSGDEKYNIINEKYLVKLSTD